MTARLLIVACLAAALPLLAQTPTVLNLSHDLTTLGLAKSNMTPDMPAQDSTPLFQAGVNYAFSHHVATLTADRGRYYFLTQSEPYTHVIFGGSNLTIDMQYSDLYFANGSEPAMFCYSCSGVTLQNFTLDYINLPFTQVQVTALNASAGMISFQDIPGWADPSSLNSYAAGGTSQLFFFRNGQQLAQTSFAAAATPFSGSSIKVTNLTAEGSLPSNLAAIQPGDTMVVAIRINAGTLFFGNGSNNTIRNVTVYSGAQLGFNIYLVSNTTLDQLQVIPRPGTDRLISTDADGIHINISGANNVISNSTVRRACDDGIAIDGQWYATVNGPNNGATVAVTSMQPVTLAAGLQLDFIDIADATVLGTATVTAVNPPVAQQTGQSGQVVTLTLDQTLNGLQAGYGVMPSSPSLRGGGSIIRNNLVQEETYDRGIYIPGVENLTVTDNMTSSTNNGGIVIGEDNQTSYYFKTGTASGVTIHNNIVNNALGYGYPSMTVQENFAAVFNYVLSSNYVLVTTTPESNFTFTGNLITNTPRSGIRTQNVNGGTISGNTILNYAQAPDSYLDNFGAGPGETLQQFEADFSQPIVVARSTGVTSTNNVTTGSLVTSVSDANGGLRLAPGSIASAYGANLASTTAGASTAILPTSLGGASVTVTDNTGTARQAGLFYVSPGQINYQVPMGTAPGVARVTIGSAVGGILVGTVAPGLFSANGTGNGVAAADAVRVAADGTQTPLSVFQCGASGCVSTPMSLGAATDTLIVEFFGTGIQGFSSLTNVVAQVNGIPAQVQFAGATQSAGLDQVNIVIPASLAGAGEVPVILMVDGQIANVVTINIQ